MHRLMPTVGGWFKDLESGELFEIVAVDPVSETVEVQFLDGEVDEYDLDSWHALRLQQAAPPEDWQAPFELDPADRDPGDEARSPESWSNPLNLIEAPEPQFWLEA